MNISVSRRILPGGLILTLTYFHDTAPVSVFVFFHFQFYDIRETNTSRKLIVAWHIQALELIIHTSCIVSLFNIYRLAEAGGGVDLLWGT